MQTSEQINELAGALAKAQGKITGALKDSANPFFRSKYADLASCWDAARDHLSANGLAVVQTTLRGEPITIKWDTTNEKTGEVNSFSVDTHEIVIETMLIHSSGQWIRSPLHLVPRDVSPQGIGSCITYGRRYGLAAVVGIAQVDDDGNAASGRDKHDPRGETVTVDTAEKNKYVSRFLDALNADLDEDGMAKLVHSIHSEIASKSDLYIAVADELGPKHKSAIKAFVKHHNEASKRGAQELRDANRMRAMQ